MDDPRDMAALVAQAAVKVSGKDPVPTLAKLADILERKKLPFSEFAVYAETRQDAGLNAGLAALPAAERDEVTAELVRKMALQGDEALGEELLGRIQSPAAFVRAACALARGAGG